MPYWHPPDVLVPAPALPVCACVVIELVFWKVGVRVRLGWVVDVIGFVVTQARLPE